MTREQETMLLEATLAVTRCTLQLARLPPEHRSFTDRHRAMIGSAAENFEQASALLRELIRTDKNGA
jgi:hypothetical protein